MYEFITEIRVMFRLNSFQWIHMSDFTTEFNTMNSEYFHLFSVMNSYHEFMFINQIYEFRLGTMNSLNYSYVWIHIFMNSYKNSESIFLNSCTWIHILMNSYIHFTYEFTSMWIHIIMNSYNDYLNSYVYEFTYNEFIYEFI